MKTLKTLAPTTRQRSHAASKHRSRASRSRTRPTTETCPGGNTKSTGGRQGTRTYTSMSLRPEESQVLLRGNLRRRRCRRPRSCCAQEDRAIVDGKRNDGDREHHEERVVPEQQYGDVHIGDLVVGRDIHRADHRGEDRIDHETYPKDA
ncbi:hypothetical protein FI667_g894, partial [Globisporangium splendens]